MLAPVLEIIYMDNQDPSSSCYAVTSRQDACVRGEHRTFNIQRRMG